MLTIAAPDAAETRCNTTFAALMWALARPGEPREMPDAGMAPIIEALIDRECVAWTDAPALAHLIAASGARTGTAETADHLFVQDTDRLADIIVAVRCGSALYPDEGATVIAQASLDSGPQLRLSGPGIEGARLVRIGLPAPLWALRAQLCLYPEGFEMLLVDGPAVLGIPRSTHIEVL